MASFNVMCPSCENTVIIKSNAMIGKKTDCPKCKYRFKVEDPSQDDESPKAKTADKGKKKAKGNSKMLVGVIVGVLALGLLAVGGFFLFGDGKKKDTVATTQPVKNNNNNGGGAGGADPVNNGGENPNPNGGGNQAVKRPSLSNKDVSNLLPGETVSLYRFNMDRVASTPMYTSMFDRNTLDFFKNSMTFEIGDIETYIHCIVGRDRFNFDVFRLKKPIDEGDLLRRLDQTKGPNSPIKRKYYQTLKSNAFLNSVGRVLSTETLFGEAGLPTTDEDKKRWGENKPQAYCLFDAYTLIVAEQTTLERFLSDLDENDNPPFRTDLTPDNATPPAADNPMGEGGPGAAPPGGPGAVPPPGGPEGVPAPPRGGRGGPRADELGLRQFVNPLQKTMNPQKPAPPGSGGRGGPPGGGPATIDGPPGVPGEGTAPQAPRRNYTSIPTYRSIDEGLKAMMNHLEEDEKNPPAILYAEKFDRGILNQRDLGRMAAQTRDIMGVVFGLLQNANILGGAITTFARDKMKAQINFSYNTVDDAKNSTKEHIVPLLNAAKIILSFFLGTSIEVRDSTGSGGGGGGPGESPAGPGGRGAIAGPGDGGFVQGDGRPQGPPGGGRGGPPGSGDPSGAAPPGGGNTQSHIDISLIDKTVAINFDILWSEERYKKNVLANIASIANQLKGRMAVLSGETTWHNLASAFPKMTAAKKPFPRGTSERDLKPERFGLAYPPEHRTSFFVELLPFIGKGGLRSKVQDKKFAWYAKENMAAAQEWVPEFLVPYYPQSSWRAFHPLAEDAVLGATNFVALAGLGMDAGRYDPNNPEHAKKVGMAGYEFGSKPEEVTDGLSNTIYLIQVKPGFQRPWIAGGGATVMAVNDKADNPIYDFADTTPDKKRGTYVLMGDGSVRWVSDTVDKKTFLAMVTRAGGEKIGDLDAIAPKIAAPKKEVEIKGAGSGGTPLPGSAGGDTKPEVTAVDPGELQKLQGTWKVTYASISGKKVSAEELATLQMELAFDGTRIDMRMKGPGGSKDDPAQIKLLDPKKKQIDVKGDKDKEPDYGIYEFTSEDKVKLRFAKDGAKRPTELRIPEAGSKDIYMEIERVK